MDITNNAEKVRVLPIKDATSKQAKAEIARYRRFGLRASELGIMTKYHRAFGVHPTIPFRMFSKSEISKLLGCTIRTLDRMIAAGRIPYVEMPTGRGKGHKIKFDSRDIEKWIYEHRRGSKDEEPPQTETTNQKEKEP